MSTFHYKMAPVTGKVVEIVEYDLFSNKVIAAQKVDITLLNEPALHRLLFILKNKIDPVELGTVTEAWRNLPNISSTKLDPNLQKLYPYDQLLTLLKNFLNLWFKETIESKNFGELKEKFKSLPSWENLHTVKPQSVASGRLVVSQSGVTIEPEECTQRLGQLAKRINDLAAFIEDCDKMSAGTQKDNCLARNELIETAAAQAQDLPCLPRV